MGLDIHHTQFTSGDYRRFGERLERNLERLRQTLAIPGFGEGAGSLGAELELYIVDRQGRPALLNTELQAAAGDPQLTLELNRYNLEYNLTPVPIAGDPLSVLEQEILGKLDGLRRLAAERDARIVPIGILPTLQLEDFGRACLTDKRRFAALVEQLIARRGRQFKINLNGKHPLQLEMDDITLEGANTSFQVHYRVAPQHFADTFNAIQAVTPLAVAIAGNSPTLFGHSLWQETRIPLFKQSIDTRLLDRYNWHEPARVNFGQGWARREALELFVEAVRLYQPLLPVCAEELAGGDVSAQPPQLPELQLHQSTVWLWNRPVYDASCGGHLRIEMRALPAGPTAADMVANAAFLIGMAEGLRPTINTWLPALPFNFAEYNFYRAAQFGLESRLVWPRDRQCACEEQTAAAIVADMLPVARRGLIAIGIDEVSVSRYLGIIERRLENGQTGARWQLARLARTGADSRPGRADLQAMLDAYLKLSAGNNPVAEWPL
ncbi:glutamate--cysteine ligase [Kineobactrum sediminis]|uniref:Glutamate--cysteine ligase n=1 Tax=Kineobactrum sediminis TaxID=1905677 RepID=A0A2N5Y1T9_9GAMM|nr:glutamate--cysteine ligase [Kineobactrum sediminis]PLW82348.1 glutamate--cysteine ligase [Kineobactrum sediminis]